ncbi:signal-transducing adaptor protein 2 isoform X2 [Anas acuta]|uniref:signal-transducing adaptor protein 2 isoform X2 n=1 Tax=Anas acuta TaxID=28680 RepID=UPI0035C90E29
MSVGGGCPRLGCPQPLEALDLSELVAVRSEGGALVIYMRDQNVKLKTESVEAQEVWRGFILTMAQMEVPPDLVLLPGHRFLLQEALREEQQRRKRPREPLVLQSPSCFYNVSRGEAEQLLERSGGNGNMVLRPGGHGHGISVTTRQMLNGTALIRHYKVIDTGQGYCISVDVPHCCSSLAEVVQYFVEKSKGTLRPLNSEYNQKLEFVEMDRENGETLQGVYELPLDSLDPQTPPPALPPKPQAYVPPSHGPQAPHRPEKGAAPPLRAPSGPQPPYPPLPSPLPSPLAAVPRDYRGAPGEAEGAASSHGQLMGGGGEGGGVRHPPPHSCLALDPPTRQRFPPRGGTAPAASPINPSPSHPPWLPPPHSLVPPPQTPFSPMVGWGWQQDPPPRPPNPRQGTGAIYTSILIY